MTINVPVSRAREFFESSFCESAEASFATAPGERGTEVTLTDPDGKMPYGDLREALNIPTMKSGDVLGHEFVGRIVEVGPGVKNRRAEQRVVVPFPIACGGCMQCTSEKWSLCENTNPNAALAEKMYGHTTAGLFGYSYWGVKPSTCASRWRTSASFQSRTRLATSKYSF